MTQNRRLFVRSFFYSSRNRNITKLIQLKPSRNIVKIRISKEMNMNINGCPIILM